MIKDASGDRIIDFEKTEIQLNELISNLSAQSSMLQSTTNHDLIIKIDFAEWHAQGVLYHCKNILNLYKQFAFEVMLRANNCGPNTPDIIWMYSPVVQSLMFEFHAFVNLSKITLDNLSKLIAPLFVEKHLPKSITSYRKGTTNCPVFEKLAETPIIDYLINLRDCLVHYISFATNDNACVIRETSELNINNELSDIGSMTRAFYRIDNEGTTIVNILLPKTIFKLNSRGERSLARFQYDSNKSMLGFCVRVVEEIVSATIEIYSYIEESTKKRFKYSKIYI